jgi:hypothetical protein
MKKSILRLAGIFLMYGYCLTAYAQKDIYEIKVYAMKSAEQITATDNYLRDAYIPAMHRLGLKQVGVFKPISNDTALVKEIYVIVPYISAACNRRSRKLSRISPN